MLNTIRFLSIFMIAGFLSACNTMSGLGEDVKGAGESLENSANKHKNSDGE